MRKVTVEAELGAPQQIAAAGTAIAAVDYRLGGTLERPEMSFVTVDAAGIGRLRRSESRTNMMTGEVTTTPDLVGASGPAGRRQGHDGAR